MSGIEKLLDVMRALRDKETGCPWDRQQDFASIAPYTVEEAYEVADAIERCDMRDLKSELGDLLFQVVFHAQMAEEDGEFNFDDVAVAIAEKMIRRHPHVFGDEKDKAGASPEDDWERIKAGERRAESTDHSAVAGVAAALPALKRAQKLGKRAARVGFDWPDLGGVRAKIDEELTELEIAIGGRDPASTELEFGDLLFAVVNMARHLDIDPENALLRANRKFESRFRAMEADIEQAGKRIERLSPESLERYWRKAKKAVG